MRKLTLILLSIFLIANAHAKIMYVSATGNGTTGDSWTNAFTTVAAALASASVVAGDEVWVKQGTYVSATTLTWKNGVNFYGGFVGNETQKSERNTDASLTVIEGNNTNRVLNTTQLATATTWDGFTIQKGLTSGGGAGIFMQRNAILINCIVQNNLDTNWGGAGIYIQTGDTDSIKVINCTIRNNTATSTDTRTDKHGGGGIRIRPDASKAVVRNSIIENNTVDGLGNSTSGASGGGIYMAAGKLENSIVRNNTATNKNATTHVLSFNGKCQGGGIFIMPQTNTNTITVKNCTVSGNIANTSIGGGISIDPLWTSAIIASPIQITQTYITNNKAYSSGGGVFTDGRSTSSTANYVFSNCVLANNESSTVAAGGGGAFVNNIAGYSGNVSFNFCTVANNKMLTTNFGGAGIFYNNIKSDINNTVFWGNSSVTAMTRTNLRLNTNLTTNKISHSAFDKQFVESEVSPLGFEADLTGKVIVENQNAGTNRNLAYANFVSPTSFAGNASTEAQQLELTNANWAIQLMSGLRDKGQNITGINNDMAGANRNQGLSVDIGAFEKAVLMVNSEQNISNLTLNSGSDLVIGSEAELIIDQSTTVNSILIEPTAKLSNINGQTLNVLDNLLINSNENGTGTYVEKNNSVLNANSNTVYQYLSSTATGPGGRNWYVSSPLNAALSSNISSNTSNGLVYYNETNNEWVAAPTTMLSKVGYIALSPANNTIVEFSGGQLNTGQQDVSSLSYTDLASKKGFHLIGNPYPSFLNWDDAIRNNIGSSIWYRTKINGTYEFQTYNAVGQIGTLGGTKYIPPMQSFWVRALATENSLSFDNDMRSHQNQSLESGRLKSQKSNLQPVIRLQISNQNKSDEAVIYFNSSASNDDDDFDSKKMFNNNNTSPEIYSINNNEKLVINGLNNYTSDIRIGYYNELVESLTIKLNEFSHFDNDVNLILRDNETGHEHNFAHNAEYNFISNSNNYNERFALIFRVGTHITANEKNEMIGFNVFLNPDNKIVLTSNKTNETEMYRIVVTDVLGIERYNEELKSAHTTIPQNFGKGIFVVSLIGTNTIESKKIKL